MNRTADSDNGLTHMLAGNNKGKKIAVLVQDMQYECVILDCSSPKRLLLQISNYCCGGEKQPV